MSKEKFNSKLLSIIIPTLNEEKGIAKVINSIPSEIREQAEVIVVDASTDSTPIIAKKLGARVICSKKRGKGRAMREAVKKSKGEILIFLDGDATDPPQYIPDLLKQMNKANIVLACRSNNKFKEDDNISKYIYPLYSIVCQPLFHLINFSASDPLAGFRAIRKKDWQRLGLKSDDFRIETEMNIKAIKEKFVIKEIQIPRLERAGGVMSSKLATDPVMWFKIVWMVLRFFAGEKKKELMIKINTEISIDKF